MFNVGDRVKVIGIPADLPVDDHLTEAVFKDCVGHTFVILDKVQIEGKLLFELEAQPDTDFIWIEPEFLEKA